MADPHHYQISLPGDFQDRLKSMFDAYPEMAKEYMRGKEYGYVKFIEEAIREHIKNKESHYMRKREVEGR